MYRILDTAVRGLQMHIRSAAPVPHAFAPGLLCIVLSVVSMSPCWAFYTWQDEERSGEARGVLQVYATAVETPEDIIFYKDNSARGMGEAARLIIAGQTNQQVAYDINLLQSYLPASLQLSRFNLPGVERSARLYTQADRGDRLQLEVDRLNLRWSSERVDIILGRQTINLATTFFFTPNDFFAPFAAQTFYRVYKPGVDALRAEFALAELSQLTLIGALGYKSEPGSGSGWSNSPQRDRNAYLARMSTVWHDVDWAVLAGRVRDNDIGGASLQGEWFDWLGVRAEGHVARPRDAALPSYKEFSLGLEHRWENSLTLQMELFYHGLGADNSAGYLAVALQQNPLYLARRYAALGASYEITPLLLGQGLVLGNLIDHSELLSINATYSLADNAELVFDLTWPLGDAPQGLQIKSEFGSAASRVNVELRHFF